MAASPHQTLQEFFDSPDAKAANYRLSASAAEPVSLDELLAFEPDADSRLTGLTLDYPKRYAPAALREAVAEKPLQGL